jgi:hypothetical protein
MLRFNVRIVVSHRRTLRIGESLLKPGRKLIESHDLFRYEIFTG